MKINAFHFGLTLLLTGCQAAPAPRTPEPAAVPVALAPSPSQVRVSEVVRSYTLGAYVDPDDPTLRHEAHMVHRIEAAAHWDLRPMAEENPARPTLPAQAEPAPVAPAPPVPPPVVAAPAVELTTDPEPAVMPNGDGVIDLTAVETPATGEVNPFTVRGQPALPPREVELRVTGIVGGAKPCALINGRVVEPGGTFDGFALQRIEPTAVVLTCGRHRLRVPIAAEPTRVRIAP